MKQQKLWFGIFPLLSVSVIMFLLSPGPWGIALNHDTKQCTDYWTGDEYAYYRLPEGWVDYYPEDGFIETKYGTCTYKGSAEACCQQLGYTYISEDIATRRYTIYTWILFAIKFWFLCPVALLPLILLFFLNRLSKLSAIRRKENN